jgi:hypothetical protein
MRKIGEILLQGKIILVYVKHFATRTDNND